MAGSSRPGEAALRHAAALFSAGRLEEARSSALELLASQPEDFLLLHLLGAIAVRAARAEEALDYETRALSIRPDDAEALCNHGIALRMLGRVDEALADYDRVLAAKPRFMPALNLRGVALAALNRHGEAIESYGKAASIDARFAPTRFNRSLSELVTGDFERGWRDFEFRWGGADTQMAKREFGKPQWHGEDPTGKAILLSAEQGLGDAIQFCRYVPMMVARGAKVVLEAQAPLAELFTQLPAQVVRFGEALPPFDWHCPIMSLALAFETRIDTVPARIPYLQAPRAHVDHWRERLGPRDRPRIGLTWSGSPTLRNDRNRSMPLDRLAMLRDTRWEFVSLQKEIRESDRSLLAGSAPIRSFGDEMVDFRDTAAIVELVDIVVSVDTAAAHLAGAMGKPACVLLPFSPDWRWLLEREDSPWYPSARLFRQESAGDWGPPLERLRQALLRRLK